MKQLVILFITFFSLHMSAQTDTRNCCTEKHQEFDFWIGSWETFTPDGKLAGRNEIDKIQDNCILRENWTSAQSGYTGTSNNFYNAQTNQWEQIWIDNQGQSLHLKGNRKGNQMILMSDAMQDQKGNTIYNRITWTKNEDGSIRQLWETTSDQKEWKIAFDGLYKRKK